MAWFPLENSFYEDHATGIKEQKGNFLVLYLFFIANKVSYAALPFLFCKIAVLLKLCNIQYPAT